MPTPGRLRRLTSGIFALVVVGAQGEPPLQRGPSAPASYIAAVRTSGAFAVASRGTSAPLFVSAADFPGVRRAASDLRADVERVTGTAPLLTTDTVPRSREVILIGTLGRSPLIDSLVAERRVDVRQVAGQWETFLLQVVEKPRRGIDRALVIAGSDKRGTIFGIYDLSAEIGVSPWYWWADVPPRKAQELFVQAGRHTKGTPAVKYRGIFLNDEAPALSGWTREEFGGYNSQFYEKVFELVLRLKGNYLWPAMWGNAFNEDDPRNPQLADEYGIVMGTSHHEPMLRAQQEWRRHGRGEWNYDQNDTTLRAFWREGIRNMGTHESIVTIGMRGDGDMPMTQGSNIALLERIVADQRRLITEVTGKDASQTPQLWALYKEVQDYYDKGMRVPDDVTLLFADDNWGNVRRLPARGDTLRKGGYGVYYHFDYVGGPRNYKWLNTNQIGRVWEQMRLSHEWGANRIWIVNVGDLKPMEFPISFFLEYAWNPSAWPAERLPEFTRRWAAQQFGDSLAEDVAGLVSDHLQLAGRRKPELLDTVTYSLTNHREFERVVASWDSLRSQAHRRARGIPAELGDAYYQLVLHPIEAVANLHELYFAVARNRAWAQQGRTGTNGLADSARLLFERDAEISRRYHTIGGGKWNHMMAQTHIGYTYWQEPPRNVMPRVDVIHMPAAADMGVSVVELNRTIPAGRGGGPPPPPPRELALPAFDRYQRQVHYIDVFNRGRASFEFAAQSTASWLRVRPSKGTVASGQRLTVDVDWSAAPAGRHRVPISITGPNANPVTVFAVLNNPAAPGPDSIVGHVEGDGYVSIEAAHFTRAVGRGGIRWQVIPELGRTLSGVMAAPVTTESQVPGGDAPRLEYQAFLFDSGTVRVRAYFSPTLNFTGAASGLRYAISFNDEPPQVVNLHADTTLRAWERAVADNIIAPGTTHTIASPGQHVLKVWMVDPGVVLQKIVIEARDIGSTFLGPPESFYRPAPPGTSSSAGNVRTRRP